MDITHFIASRREALLIGDYDAYRTQLSRQLLTLRRQLGRATPKKEKFSRTDITAQNIGRDVRFLHLLLLTSERAWAHAMHMKTSHVDDGAGRGITGSRRSHIISRLAKAAKMAERVVELLGQREGEEGGGSGASGLDILEAKAYHACLAGSEEFEKHSGGGERGATSREDEARWEACLRWFSTARVIYAAFFAVQKRDVFRELLANTVDPTIRYAAYQARLSRTIPIPVVARRYFSTEDAELVELVEQLDPYALKDKPVPKSDEEQVSSPLEVPDYVTWRGRKANIVDGSIGQALAAVTAAEARLRSYLASHPNASQRDKAAAYDDVLTAAQDAADATKRATDELEKERVDEGDPRMQDLRVTSLAVNYDLVSWRVGRNRVLIGEDDGLTFTTQQPKKPKRPRKDGTEYPAKEEPRARKLARLRERIVLYDSIIQSINSVKDLRGALRDATFVQELDAKLAYFRALKCLNISFSHSLLNSHLNALALLQRAENLTAGISDALSHQSTSSGGSPPTLHLSATTANTAHTTLAALLTRTHALVELQALESDARAAAEKNRGSTTTQLPLVHDLASFPNPGVDVDVRNLVQYPPRILPVPVKPLFLDVAWNYIEYPGRKQTAKEESGVKTKVAEGEGMVNGSKEDEKAQAQAQAQAQEGKKRGWFGFGR